MKTAAYLLLSVVDGAGFEPAASAMPTLRSYQTDLPAQLLGHTHTKNRQKAFKHYLSPEANIEEVVNVLAAQTTFEPTPKKMSLLVLSGN
jgi:hypothetical protein